MDQNPEEVTEETPVMPEGEDAGAEVAPAPETDEEAAA